MGWSNDWLYQLLLDRARDTLAEVTQAAEQRNEQPPDFLLATEHSDWDRQFVMTYGDPIRIWSSSDDFGSICGSAIWKDVRGLVDSTQTFFRIPLFSWYITPDDKQVLICRHIGPRYGNGGWWNVIAQGSRAKLKDAKRKGWIA